MKLYYNKNNYLNINYSEHNLCSIKIYQQKKYILYEYISGTHSYITKYGHIHPHVCINLINHKLLKNIIVTIKVIKKQLDKIIKEIINKCY